MKFQLRYWIQFPLAWGVACVFVLFGWLGMLVAVLLNFDTELAVGSLALTSGLFGVAIGIKAYQALTPAHQGIVRRLLGTLFCVGFGVLLGGLPGSVVGHAISKEMGEVIGWTITASIGALVGAFGGWRFIPYMETHLAEGDDRNQDGQIG